MLAALRVCPLCRTEYDPPHTRCFLDGAALSELEQEDEENTPPLGTAIAAPSLGELGPYRLLSVLGQGSMAVVYAAEHRKLGRRCAIKRLRPDHDPETAQRFLGEARAVASIQHPNLVTVYDVVAEPGEAYLVMELLDGRDLRTVLQTGPLAVERALRIAAEMCAALTPVHARGIVHRDVKPANVFLCISDGREQVKMLDFGAARLLGRQSRQAERRLRADGTTLGSPVYMSPEQVAGEALDARSDLYSLGVVLYEMLAGAPPFLGDTTSDVMLQHLHQELPRLAERGARVPEAVELLLQRCLAKGPDGRPSSSAELERELRKLGAPPGVESAGAPVDRPGSSTPPRWLAVLGVLSVAGLIAAVGVALRPHPVPPAAVPAPAVQPVEAVPPPAPERVPPPPPAATPPAPAALSAVRKVVIETTPPGVTATADGVPACTTPCTLVLAAAPAALVLRRPGFRETTVTVGPDQATVNLALVPLARRRGVGPRAVDKSRRDAEGEIPGGEIINPFRERR